MHRLGFWKVLWMGGVQSDVPRNFEKSRQEAKLKPKRIYSIFYKKIVIS